MIDVGDKRDVGGTAVSHNVERRVAGVLRPSPRVKQGRIDHRVEDIVENWPCDGAGAIQLDLGVDRCEQLLARVDGHGVTPSGE